jgi:hypothetical protein
MLPPAAIFSHDAEFQQRLERLAGRRETSSRRARDFQITFGPQSGKAGTVANLSMTPQCLFRGEKIVATDNAVPPGSGTTIMNIFVGQKMQLPTSLPSILFSPTSLGGGFKMDTCQIGLPITLQISFVKTCKFSASIFGRAIV